MAEWIKHIKINFANFLAFFIVACCMGYFFYISSNHFPQSLAKEISDVKIAMITIITAIIGYYFGSNNKANKEPPKQNP